jgi:hypothetical protein
MVSNAFHSGELPHDWMMTAAKKWISGASALGSRRGATSPALRDLIG